jgi:hypothetical protein
MAIEAVDILYNKKKKKDCHNNYTDRPRPYLQYLRGNTHISIGTHIR